MRILVIDDDPGVRVLAGSPSATGGDEYLEAASGREGLELLATEHVDAVVLERDAPSVHGFEICGASAQDDRMSDLPVVLSVRGRDPGPDRRWRAGADDYLTKPPPAAPAAKVYGSAASNWSTASISAPARFDERITLRGA